MILTASPYRLRPIEDSDIDWVFRGLSDPRVYRYYGVRYHSQEEAKTQMDWYARLRSDDTGLWFAIVDGEVALGAIGLNDYDRAHASAEIGYWLLPEYWGQGVIKATLPVVIDFGFERWRLHRIEAIVETENQASSGLLTRFGFVCEGTRRECEFKDGRFVNHVFYGLLAREHAFALKP